jgi:hypothetical protein
MTEPLHEEMEVIMEETAKKFAWDGSSIMNNLKTFWPNLETKDQRRDREVEEQSDDDDDDEVRFRK